MSFPNKNGDRQKESSVPDVSFNHSIRKDANPTEIADVETVVEREGMQGRRGTDIDVTSFVYQSSTSITVSDLGDLSGLIDEEIERVASGEDGSWESSQKTGRETSKKGVR